MNFSQIELRHLRYFLAVAEAAHFTRAAAKLHVTQPTLSQQIRELEGQLDLQLFDRAGRCVKLTEAGEALLPHARRVFRELDEAGGVLDELRGLKRGLLRVGIVQTVNACVIPEIVARFSEAHIGVRVECSEMSVAEIEADLESGKLDLGISFLPACRKTLTGEKLFSEELVAVMASDHSLAKRRQLRVRELKFRPLVLLSEKYCTRQLADRTLSQACVEPEVRVEMNTVAGILDTVRRTELISLLPSLALCQQERGLKAIQLIEPKPVRTIGLLWMQGSNRRTAATEFARVTQSVLKERNLRR
jgi:LysR family transcriptional regulator, cyn operon transcriptional activator